APQVLSLLDGAEARADVAEAELPGDRLSGRLLLLGAEGEGPAEKPGRGRSRTAQDLREARYSPQGAGDARRRRGRSRVRQRLRRHHLQEEARGEVDHLLLDLRRRTRPSGAGPEISRHGGAL